MALFLFPSYLFGSSLGNNEEKADIDGAKKRGVANTPEDPKQTTSKPHTYQELSKALSQKKVDEFIGSGEGAIKNIAANPSIYRQNAQYGEESKALSTDAKIKTQGGIDAAVATDVKESSVKAAMQKGSVEQQVKQLALSSGMSKEGASALVSAMSEGGKLAAELIAKGITGAASNMSGAQSGARTRGDLKNIEMSVVG